MSHAEDDRRAEGTEGAVNDSPTSIWLRRARSGDESALNQLLDRELPWVREMVHKRLGGVVRRLNDTGDVVNALVVRVLTKGPTLVIEGRSHFQHLLARMVMNHLRTSARPSRAGHAPGFADRVALDLDRGLADTSQAPSDAAATAEDIAWLWLAIEFLPQDDQDVVRLRALEELDYAQIGERLGLPPDTARRRYDRALPKLRRIIRELRAGKLGDLLRDAERAEAAS